MRAKFIPTLAAAAVLALGLGACGGDDSTTASAGDSSTASAATDVVAGDFILEAEDEKQATIEAVVAANPECEGVSTDRGFLLDVTSRAMDLKSSEPIEPTIVDACTP